MRPKGVIALLAIILLVGLIFYLLSDDLLERGIEHAGESMVGARVEIDDLDLDLAGLSISLDRLQVANPNDTWKNLLETGRVAFDMQLAPLFKKKLIIEDVTVAGIRVGSRRTTDGRLPGGNAASEPSGWVGEARGSLQKQVASAPILNLGPLKRKINPDSLLARVHLNSLARIEEVKQQAATSFQNWEQNLSAFKPQPELKEIEAQIQQLRAQKIEGVQDLISALNKTKKIYTRLNKIKKEIETRKQAIAADFETINAAKSHFDQWIDEDFSAVKKLANLADFSPRNVGKMLFGDAIVRPVLRVLEYVDLARKYMPTAEQLLASSKAEKPPQLEGQDIVFPQEHGQPDFLMRHIAISGATNQQDTSRVLWVSGEVNGVTSQPKLYGKPLTFALEANLPGSSGYTLTGEFDHTGEVPRERVRITATGLDFGRIRLPERPHLPAAISAHRGDLSADFALEGNRLQFKVRFTATPVSFAFPEATTQDDALSRVARSVFDAIDRLELSASVGGPAGDLSLQISSNIDDILAQRIRKVMGESAAAARAELENKLNQRIVPKKREALAFIQRGQSSLAGRLDQLKASVDRKLSVLDEKKKELEKRLADKKKKGLEKVGGKLKDIFKKKN